MRRDITSFVQFDSESLYEAWERFKDLLRKCPHHGVPKWLQVQTFYNGLSSQVRTSIDAAAGGALMAKNCEEAYNLLENMAANNYQWPTSRTHQPRVAGLHEVDSMTAFSAQVTAQLSALSKKIDSMGMQNASNMETKCELCAGSHPTDQCAIQSESVQYVGNFNRQQQQYGNSYNPGWKNHPNFSWRDNQAQNQAPRQANPPGFHNQPYPQAERHNNLDDILVKFMAGTEKFRADTETRLQVQDKMMSQMDMNIKSQSVAIRNLENQMGQIASALNNRPQGALPSDTELNPRRDGNEHCNAITLRSGRELKEFAEEKSKTSQKEEFNIEHESVQVDNSANEKKKENDAGKSEGVKLDAYVPPVPFPQRLQKAKEDKQFLKFLEVFKKLQINIPFADALAQMPSYVKFMKEILTRKRKLEDFETVALTEECSAILQNKLPPKLKDPGSFTIPCTIGNQFVGKALCDLGASINLMPLSIYQKLGLKEAKPTNVTLQLADRTVTYPRGIVEDVLVKVDKLILPADFLILDYEEDSNIPIILGRPFLATGRTIIDVQKGELTMRVNDQVVKFHVFKAMKLPDDESEECFQVQSVQDNVKCKMKMKKLSQLNHSVKHALKGPQPNKKIKCYDEGTKRWIPKRFLNRKFDPG